MSRNKKSESDGYAEEFLANLKIASPCSMKFEDMKQSEVPYQRFCGDCSKNIFDVASMTRQQVSELV
jgi:hypothetical protein